MNDSKQVRNFIEQFILLGNPPIHMAFTERWDGLITKASFRIENYSPEWFHLKTETDMKTFRDPGAARCAVHAEALKILSGGERL